MTNQTTSVEEIKIKLEKLIKNCGAAQDIKKKIEIEPNRLEAKIFDLNTLLTTNLNDFKSLDINNRIINSLTDFVIAVDHDAENAIEVFITRLLGFTTTIEKLARMNSPVGSSKIIIKR